MWVAYLIQLQICMACDNFFVQSACTTLTLTFDGKLNQLCLHTMQAGKVPGPPNPRPPNPDAAEVPGAAGEDLLKVAF